ncbi:MAG: RNA polymerase sigma factor [Flavobacteriales bacterium]
MSKLPNICKESVFNKLYEEHSKSIWRFIYYKCGDTSQADDLVQNAFLKMWQNCSKITVEKAKSFLYTVCNNAFLNEVAHKKVVLKHQSLYKDRTNYQTPHYLLEEKEFEKKLTTAINNLTEAQRTAFLLNRIEGKKYKEIAIILDISVKAVEKRISKALVSLRLEIENI